MMGTNIMHTRAVSFTAKSTSFQHHPDVQRTVSELPCAGSKKADLGRFGYSIVTGNVKYGK